MNTLNKCFWLLMFISLSSFIKGETTKMGNFHIVMNGDTLKSTIDNKLHIINPDYKRDTIFEFKIVDGSIYYDSTEYLCVKDLKKYSDWMLWICFSIEESKGRITTYQAFFIFDLIRDLRRSVTLNFYDFDKKCNVKIKNEWIRKLKAQKIKNSLIRKIPYAYDYKYNKFLFQEIRTLLIFPHVLPYIEFEKRLILDVDAGGMAVKSTEHIYETIIE